MHSLFVKILFEVMLFLIEQDVFKTCALALFVMAALPLPRFIPMNLTNNYSCTLQRPKHSTKPLAAANSSYYRCQRFDMQTRRKARLPAAVRENEPERRPDSRERWKSSLTRLHTF